MDREDGARREAPQKRNTTIPKKAADDARMASEVVLKEKPAEAGFVPVDMLGGIKPAARIRKKRRKSAASAIS